MLLDPISQRYAYVSTAAVRALPCFSSSILLAFRGPATSSVHLAEPIEVMMSSEGCAAGEIFKDESFAGAAGAAARNRRKRPRSAPPKLEYKMTFSAGCAQGVVEVSIISSQSPLVGADGGAERPSRADADGGSHPATPLFSGGGGPGASLASGGANPSRARSVSATIDKGGGGAHFMRASARRGHGGAAETALDTRFTAGESLVSPGRDVPEVVHSNTFDQATKSPPWKSMPSISPLVLSCRDSGSGLDTLTGLAAAHSSDDQIMFAT